MYPCSYKERIRKCLRKNGPIEILVDPNVLGLLEDGRVKGRTREKKTLEAFEKVMTTETKSSLEKEEGGLTQNWDNSS